MSAKFKGEEFFLQGGKEAVLLIHGFTSSTQEVESLGMALNQAGFSVLAPLLPGHNRDFAEFKKTGAEEYYKWIEEKYYSLDGYEKIHTVSISFGTILAMHLAVRHKVDKMVILSTALIYYNFFVFLTPLLQIFLKGKFSKQMVIDKATGQKSFWDLFNPDAIKERIAYNWISFTQLETTRKFIRKVRPEISSLCNPILIIHSKKDTTTKSSGSQYVYDHIGSSVKKLIWLENSGHIITEDFEADIIRKETIDFLIS